RHGPAAATASLAVEGGIPWTYAPARRAGTVHVGGSLPEIAFVERQITRGIMPRNPFVLVGQQSLADPSRTSVTIHPVESFAHVPVWYFYYVTDVILQQIQRCARGVRERIVAQSSHTALDLQTENPHFIGGDIPTSPNAF